MSPDGKSGFALKGDDIVSVFKADDTTGGGVAAATLALAVQQGGRRLDCFDTYLPSLYAKSGFQAVARLKWNEEYKPEGWDKATYKEYNKGEPDVVFMTYSGSPDRLPYSKADGAYVSEYDAGSAKQQESEPTVAGYSPGVHATTDAGVGARAAEWAAASPVKDIHGVIRAAPLAQKTFVEAADKVASDLGLTFMNPGPKTKTAKGIERTQQKIDERGGMEKVTDTARGTFILKTPDQADAVIQKLAETHEILAESWRMIPQSHYADRALLFRDKATGLVGEVQMMDQKMWDAKKVGHELYEEARALPPKIDGKQNPRVAE